MGNFDFYAELERISLIAKKMNNNNPDKKLLVDYVYDLHRRVGQLQEDIEKLASELAN